MLLPPRIRQQVEHAYPCAPPSSPRRPARSPAPAAPLARRYRQRSSPRHSALAGRRRDPLPSLGGSAHRDQAVLPLRSPAAAAPFEPEPPPLALPRRAASRAGSGTVSLRHQTGRNDPHQTRLWPRHRMGAGATASIRSAFRPRRGALPHHVQFLPRRAAPGRSRTTPRPLPASSPGGRAVVGPISAWRSRRSRGARRPRRRGRPCPPRRPCPRRAGRRSSCCRPRRRS